MCCRDDNLNKHVFPCTLGMIWYKKTYIKKLMLFKLVGRSIRIKNQYHSKIPFFSCNLLIFIRVHTHNAYSLRKIMFTYRGKAFFFRLFSFFAMWRGVAHPYRVFPPKHIPFILYLYFKWNFHASCKKIIHKHTQVYLSIVQHSRRYRQLLLLL